MSPTVRSALDAYMDIHSPENFVRLQVAVAVSAEYHPYTNYMTEVDLLMKQENFDKAMNFLVLQMPNRVLNPGIHKLLSFIQHKRGDKEAAHTEYTLAMLFLEGLLSTGSGTEEKPYVVLHVEDEHDILEHLGQSHKSVTLVRKGEAAYDKVVSGHDTVVWFDVTALQVKGTRT